MGAKALLACLCLCACSAPVLLASHFDPAEVAWFSGTGTNSIQGTAILRSDSGSVKTCAALPVMLFPVSAYAAERMRALYGNGEDGFNPIVGGRPADFVNDDPRYLAAVRTLHCDARGRFAFAALPDGDYFLVAQVTWKEGRYLSLEQGGYLMQRLHIQTGESKDVLLAH
jgi:hypothetical protein